MNSHLIEGSSLKKQTSLIASILSDYGLEIPEEKIIPPSVFPDLHIVSSESSIGIEEVRKIIQFLSLKPFSWKTKAVIVFSAEKLTPEAQNALLKTLEEPPVNSVILLAALSSDSLLQTISSRVQIHHIESDTTEIDLETENKCKDFIISILGKNLSKALNIVSEIGNREDALEFCETGIKTLRNQIKNPSYIEIKTAAKFIRDFEKTISFLKSNTHVRLTLDNLLILLRKRLI